MLAFHYDALTLPLPVGHRFPQSKYRLLREHFERQPGRLRMMAAPPATGAELALVHTPAYIDAVMEGWLSAAEQREIGFPWSPTMAERSCHSVGATIAAARAALAEGLPPTWRAERTTRRPARARGFACSTTWRWLRG